MDQHPITLGARLLREHLTRTGQSVPKFCEAHGLCRIRVQRALTGERHRIAVDFALVIERATSGAVPMSAWASETAELSKAAA